MRFLRTMHCTKRCCTRLSTLLTLIPRRSQWKTAIRRVNHSGPLVIPSGPCMARGRHGTAARTSVGRLCRRTALHCGTVYPVTPSRAEPNRAAIGVGSSRSKQTQNRAVMMRANCERDPHSVSHHKAVPVLWRRQSFESLIRSHFACQMQ